MSKRNIAIVVIILGVLLVIASLAADSLGIGAHPGIGWKQILGAVVGVLLALGGVWWGWIRSSQKR
jgi:uncharacterized membrane protein